MGVTLGKSIEQLGIGKNTLIIIHDTKKNRVSCMNVEKVPKSMVNRTCLNIQMEDNTYSFAI